MQKLLLIFFFLLYIISTKAQTNKFAELKINLKCKTDTGFINRLNLLYKEIYNENSDSAYSIA
jgi:hypothetical protein